MNKRQAKRIAYQVASVATEDAMDNWKDFIDEEISVEDDDLVREALRQIAHQLNMRSG